jgi:RNA polymerase sigma-70 factor (ECF subfamily)
MMKNENDAEDVLQETFLSAFQAIGDFEGRSKLGTWLHRIAVNTALMRLRKNRPVIFSMDEDIQTDDGGYMPRQFFDWCCMPESELMDGEAREKLWEAIDNLSDTLRMTFILRDIEGYSTRETAETLNVSESAVKSRVMRARLALREELSAYFAGRAQKEAVP